MTEPAMEEIKRILIRLPPRCPQSAGRKRNGKRRTRKKIITIRRRKTMKVKQNKTRYSRIAVLLLMCLPVGIMAQEQKKTLFSGKRISRRLNT
ncbi:hypothetical protein SFC43_13685 [Bacteroides sp. CR5/BHMF/2]|nr:hypothetical protein [Bacteroides sp. CR5/BHMF/2]